MKIKLLLLIFILGTSIAKSQISIAPLMGNYWSVNTTTMTQLMGTPIVTTDTISIFLTKTSDSTFSISGFIETLYYIIKKDSTFHSTNGLGSSHFTKDSIYFMFDRGLAPVDWSVSGKGKRIITGIPNKQNPGFSITIEKELILINMNTPIEYSVSVTDINGKALILKKCYNNDMIGIDHLLTGVYFLNIHANGSETHKKFLKIN